MKNEGKYDTCHCKNHRTEKTTRFLLGRNTNPIFTVDDHGMIARQHMRMYAEASYSSSIWCSEAIP